MFDEDEDVPQEVIEDDYLPNQIDNTEDEEDETFIDITDDMLDPRNPELTYRPEEDDTEDDIIPASVPHKFAGIPRSIWSLATFIILMMKEEYTRRSITYGKRNQ
jgi:hypothetical protein